MSARLAHGLTTPTGRVIGPLLLIVIVLGLWQWGNAAGYLSSVRFPAPSRIVGSLIDLTVSGFPVGTTLWDHTAITLRRIFAGFLLAVLLAVPLGLLIGSWHLLDRLTGPTIAFCRSVATLSLLPLAVAWFGTGEASKVFLIGYGCFWVMIANVIAAIKQVDPLLVRAARTMDTPGYRIFLLVVLPAALPRIAAGARIAIGVGFMVIVGAEMIGTIHGLGALIMEARTFYRSDITLVGMLVIGVIGLAFAAGLGWLERRLLPWQARQEAQGR